MQKKKGRMESLIEVVEKLLKKGSSIEEIMDVTGLSEQQIKGRWKVKSKR